MPSKTPVAKWCNYDFVFTRSWVPNMWFPGSWFPRSLGSSPGLWSSCHEQCSQQGTWALLGETECSWRNLNLNLWPLIIYNPRSPINNAARAEVLQPTVCNVHLLQVKLIVWEVECGLSLMWEGFMWKSSCGKFKLESYMWKISHGKFPVESFMWEV